MSLRFSLNSSKYVHFWTLVLKTINPNKISFTTIYKLQAFEHRPHVSNWVPHFPPFWKFGILGLVDDFMVCIKIFVEVIWPCKNLKQQFFQSSKNFYETGLGLKTFWGFTKKCENKNLSFSPSGIGTGIG